MNLFEIDFETKLPIASAEIRVVPEFAELVRRVRKVDGDFDGRKKTLNNKELGYIYFTGKYDSRFKLYSEVARDVAVRKLLKMPEDWQPDELVKQCLIIFIDSQITESTELVEVLGKTVQNLTGYIRTAQQTLTTATLDRADEVDKFLAVLAKIPKTIEQLRSTREQLAREQDAKERGRKGRNINKFEEAD